MTTVSVQDGKRLQGRDEILRELLECARPLALWDVRLSGYKKL